MKIEEVRKFLHNKGDFQLLFIDQDLVFELPDSNSKNTEKDSLQKSFLDHGLEAWINNHRLVVTKVYKSFTYFKESWKDDQIVISNLLNFLPLKYKNNLYFLLVLECDWEQGMSDKLQTEINKVEKNSKYCRKYILQYKDDFDRIPFFHNFEKKNTESVSYEKRFVELLTEDSENFDSNIIEAIKDYFQPEMRIILDDKLKFKLAIEKRFGGEVSHAVTPDEY